jgi:hypothetical protein
MQWGVERLEFEAAKLLILCLLLSANSTNSFSKEQQLPFERIQPFPLIKDLFSVIVGYLVISQSELRDCRVLKIRLRIELSAEIFDVFDVMCDENFLLVFGESTDE